jgi:hypothetical protein
MFKTCEKKHILRETCDILLSQNDLSTEAELLPDQTPAARFRTPFLTGVARG